MRIDNLKVLKEWQFAAEPIHWQSDKFIVKIQRVRSKESKIQYRVTYFEGELPTYFHQGLYDWDHKTEMYYPILHSILLRVIRQEKLDDMREVIECQ